MSKAGFSAENAAFCPRIKTDAAEVMEEADR